MSEYTLDTSRRIKVGIWGLGRGMSFYRSCEALGVDVVAGCDYNEHMRTRFLEQCPGAFATDDAEAFLAHDMDAVLLATFSTEHADDAIRCLRAGKHVLSEVTSFHTMAQGVRLVEDIEKSGLVYQLAENYPFTKEHMFLAEQYRRGLFGELHYAEFEYLHNCLRLSYCYIDGTPIEPGDAVHFWRSWIHFHYYNTHSLGPMMYITGLRPTRVVSLLSEQGVPGFFDRQYQGVAPSLIHMSNGALMRNLMGATSSDGHIRRLWGTQGAAEITGQGLQLRLGGGLGEAGRIKLPVEPRWPEGFGELAEKTGHGGGDFWVLYFFTREIRDGTPGPFDVYTAADCTSAGILAYRSAVEGGAPYDVPDFRDKAQRDAWRDDQFAQERFDVRGGCFPAGADPEITRTFSSTMSPLVDQASNYLAITNWTRLWDMLDESSREKIREARDRFMKELPQTQQTYRQAKRIMATYPESNGARVLQEMLGVGGAEHVLAGEFPEWENI